MKCTIPKIKQGSYKSGAKYWQVSYSLDGSQKKLKFSTEREANEHRQDIIRKFHGGLNMKEQELATNALNRFKSHQVTNPDLEGLELIDLIEWACVNYQKPTGATIEGLAEEFLGVKESQNLREDTLIELRSYINWFKDKYPKRKPESFNQTELRKILKGENVNRVGVVKHFFAWMSGTSKMTPNPSPILRDTPFRGWVTGKRDDDKTEAVAIWDASECEEILNVASDPKYNAQGIFAFMLFSGCRPKETFRIWDDVQKYGWNLINFENKKLKIPAAVSKTRSTRYLEMTDTLIAWLKFYEDRKTLLPDNWNDKYRYVRKAAGLDIKKKDVPRHTYITQRMKQGMTMDDVAIQCGNSPKIILKHYAALSSKEDSDNFFALTPDKFNRHDITPEEYKALMIADRNERLGEQREKVKELWAAQR